jgi:hypothetical protein
MKKNIDMTHMGPLYDGSQHGHADFRGSLERAIKICRVDFERIVCVRFLRRKYEQLYKETFNQEKVDSKNKLTLEALERRSHIPRYPTGQWVII